MSEWLTQADREEAIYILNKHLTHKQMRDVINRAVEDLVARTERAKGNYKSHINDEDLAAFLIDVEGVDLLKKPEMREALVKSLDGHQIETLAGWDGESLPRSQRDRIKNIVGKRWHPGKQWSQYFANFLGFPKIFAGLVGSPNGPAIEEVEPYIHLPDLYDYQLDLLVQLQQVFKTSSNQKRALLSLPTGAGKTRTAVEALLTWWNKDEDIKPYLLWIAQSDELCEQAAESFREVWIDKGGDGVRKTLRIYRCWGSYKALPEEYADGVIVASIQKLQKSIQSDDGKEELQRIVEDVAAIVIDEGHRSTTTSYTEVLEASGFKFGRDTYSPAPLIGLTATPYRGFSNEENQKLARRYNSNLLTSKILGDDPLQTLRERGVLSHVNHEALKTNVKFELTSEEAQYFQQMNELPMSFVTRVGQDAKRNNLLIEKLVEIPENWPVLCFGCSVHHASALAVLLRRKGRTAAVVTAETRRATRRHLIEEFRQGHLQVLCNYGVLTTGFDAPKIRAVIIARPTTSVVLYEQMIGRGMRGPSNGGTDRCLVVDLTDNIVRFQGQMAYKRMEDLWKE
jgi:DNA repair protein RadD